MKLEDVARQARVSPSTVSRVLSKTGRVSERTRARVLKIAGELRYRPDVHAQALAGGKSRTLGLIVSNLQNPFFLDVFQAAEAEAHRQGYEVIVANTDYHPRRLVSAAHWMLGRRIAGLGLVVSEKEPALLAELQEAGIPLREALQDGNVPHWEAAVGRPDLFLWEEWALAISADKVSTAITRARRNGPHYECVKMIAVKGAPVIEIYRRHR